MFCLFTITNSIIGIREKTFLWKQNDEHQSFMVLVETWEKHMAIKNIKSGHREEMNGLQPEEAMLDPDGGGGPPVCG